VLLLPDVAREKLVHVDTRQSHWLRLMWH